MSNKLPKDSSKVSYTQTLIVSKKFDNFAKITLRVTETGPWRIPGRVAQSVTCLSTDACLTADPGVASSIPARYHTFVEIDHEIISTVILLPSTDLFKKGCCQSTTVGYESHDRAAPEGAAAPKIAAPEIYSSLLEAQRGIIPFFFRFINCK